MTSLLAVGLALGSGAVPAQAQPPAPSNTGGAAGPAGAVPLPPGWSVTAGPAGPQLTWQAPAPVPMGDAAVQFFAGERLLGTARAAADQRTFHLDVPPTDLPKLTDLQVRAAGRRLDVAPGARRAPRTPAVVPPAAELPATAVDPGTPGRYRTVSGEYTLPAVRLPGFAEPVEMQGVVVAPQGAPGRRPLALFLHGRHFTCFSGPELDDITGDWPCAAGAEPVPSHRGYLQAQQLLAGQGYVTVSISANGINGQDHRARDDGGAQARSSLVRLHLDRWADWATNGRSKAPPIVRTAPPADVTKTLLVGHSRGGEGVNRAAIDSLSPPPADQDGFHGRVRWRIAGTVLIGPTAFGQNPAADVPSVTILPGCDGDVYDLQGQVYVDETRGVSRGTALHSAVYMIGANHNFYNTEWTPGQAKAPAMDDAGFAEGDPVCSPGPGSQRLTPVQQQTGAATYIAAAAQLFVGRDDRIRPLLDGTGVRAPSAGPARVLSHAVGAGRTPLLLPAPDVQVTGAGARLCSTVQVDPDTGCNPPEPDNLSPHFVPFGDMFDEPGRHAVTMTWSAPGTPVRLKPGRPVSVAGARSVALRLVVPPNTTGTRFEVAVSDAAGRRAVLGEARLDGLPSGGFGSSLWGQEVRVPLAPASAAGLDLRRLAALELVPRTGGGQAWLIDAWGWRPGTPVARPAPLPRVDVGEATVDEGDSGVRTYRVPVRVTGTGTGQVRLSLTDRETSGSTYRVVTVRPGTRRIDVPVQVTGNTRHGGEEMHLVSAKAVRGTVVGDTTGWLLVRNDDPEPRITFTPLADRVTEGGTLRWRVSLSAPSDATLWAVTRAAPPTTGAELSTTDVDEEWYYEHAGEPREPSRPLSSVRVYVWATLAPGELESELAVSTAVDELVEPAEHVRLQLLKPQDSYDDPEEPVPGVELTGTVVDRP